MSFNRLKIAQASATAFLKSMTPANTYGTLVAINALTGPKGGFSYNSDTISRAQEFIDDHRKDNLYWTPNAVRKGINKKPTKADIASMRWVHLDIDDLSEAALRRVRCYRVPPTMIVCSGGGYNVYWALDEPIIVNGNIDELEAANKRVLMDLDPSHPGTHNLDRILRLPGTTNWPTKTKLKRGREPVEARLIDYKPDRRYDLSDFGTIKERQEVPPKRKAVGAGGIDTDRSVDLLKRVAQDVRAGKPDYEIVAVHKEHPHAKDQPNPERAVERCIKKARAEPIEEDTTESAEDLQAPERLTLDDMLARFVHISTGPQVIDIENIRRTYSQKEFVAAYAHCRQPSGQGGSFPITLAWSQSPRRKTADSRYFDPSEAQFFTQHGLRQFNTWSPPSWPKVEDYLEIAQPFFSHLEYVIPDETCRNDLLDWLAHAVQIPGVRPHHHFLLVAQSEEGIGRSWIIDLLIRLYTERHAGLIDLHKLIADPFNSEMSGKIIVGVNEMRVPADERYSHKDRMKSQTTDSEITINEKNKPRWREKYCARFLMLTNRDDAMPLSETDRRIYAVRCADTPKKPKYYRRLYGLLGNRGFLAAVWTALRARNISQFDPGRRAPLNEMKQQVIDAGRTSEQCMAVDLVTACPYPVVSARDLMQTLVPHLDAENARDRKARMNAVTAVLKDIGKQVLQHKVRVDNTTTRVWALKNAAEWSAAKSADLKKAAELSNRFFKMHNFKAEALLGQWEEKNDE